jgi:hypothetical protein
MRTVEVPLHAVAHGRAGDKGNRANVSIVAYDPNIFEVLAEQVTEEKVLNIFRYRGASGVKRYALPNLSAFNFVIDDALEGGVNASLNADGHGKTLSFLLLGELMVRLPKESLPNGSPYL